MGKSFMPLSEAFFPKSTRLARANLFLIALYLKNTIKASIKLKSCLQNTVHEIDKLQVTLSEEIDEEKELELRDWRTRRESYVTKARDSISSFRRGLDEGSRKTSIRGGYPSSLS